MFICLGSLHLSHFCALMSVVINKRYVSQMELKR